MKKLSESLAALPVSAPLAVSLRAAKLRGEGRDVISFCVGEPDFDTPPAAAEAGVGAILRGVTKYTNASGAASLREAVCTALERDMGLRYRRGNIAVTTGAKYAVYAAVRALCDPGDEVILPAPYWTSYYQILRLAGCTPVVIPGETAHGYKLLPSTLDAAVTPRTKALLLNNPVNPSGAVYSRRELELLAEVIRRRDLYVVADEIYAPLVYDGQRFCSAAALSLDMQRRTVLIGGVSKAYAMTGWRIGWCAARRDVIRPISAFLSHTTGCPSSVGQAAAAAALLGPQDEKERMRRVFESRRNALCEGLRRLGLGHVAPAGTFYAMVDVRPQLHGRSDLRFALELLEKEGVAAVPCTEFGMPGHLRLSFTLSEARMWEGLARIARFIGREERFRHG